MDVEKKHKSKSKQLKKLKYEKFFKTNTRDHLDKFLCS